MLDQNMVNNDKDFKNSGYRNDLSPDFIGIDPLTGRYINNKYAKSLDAKDLTATDVEGSQGNFSTFGNDYLGKFTDQQRKQISSELLKQGMYRSDHGDIVIDDQDKARQIASALFGTDSAAPGSATTTTTDGPQNEQFKPQPTPNYITSLMGNQKPTPTTTGTMGSNGWNGMTGSQNLQPMTVSWADIQKKMQEQIAKYGPESIDPGFSGKMWGKDANGNPALVPMASKPNVSNSPFMTNLLEKAGATQADVQSASNPVAWDYKADPKSYMGYNSMSTAQKNDIWAKHKAAMGVR
jgi:hypothetical protein